MTIPANQNSKDTAPVYMQLILGKTRLLIPGAEILSLEAIPEIGAAGANGSIGVARLNGAELPVYNFDEQLQQLHRTQDSRRACACLGDSKTSFALLCDKVENVEGASLQIFALPACMRTANTPVRCLAVQDTRIFCVSSVERLAGFINISFQDEARA